MRDNCGFSLKALGICGEHIAVRVMQPDGSHEWRWHGLLSEHPELLPMLVSIAEFAEEKVREKYDIDGK